MTETDEVTKTLNYFAEHLKDAAFVWRNNTGAYKTQYGGYVRFGKEGSGDIIGLMANGVFLSIEMKFGKGKQKPMQEFFQKHVETMKGLYILAYSMEEAVSKFKSYMSGLGYTY